MRAVFACLVITLLLSSCSRPTRPTNLHIDPALATLIPADTQFLVGTKLEKLRDTPAYRKYFSRLPNQRLDEFVKETGVDPRTDLWELLYCAAGKDTGVLMVRGKFAPTDMEPKLEKEGATRFAYKGYSLFGNDRSALFFMTPSVALAGATPRLKWMIDNRNNLNTGVPPALQPLVNAISSDAQFWAAFTGGINAGLRLPETGMMGNLNQILGAIQSGSLSADLRTGLDLKAAGTCSSEQGARQIRDLLKGLIGLGRLNTPAGKPELLRVYDAIQVDNHATAVTLSAQIPEELVEKVVTPFLGH